MKKRTLSLLSVVALGTVALAGCAKTIPEEERKWGPSSEEIPAVSVEPKTYSFEMPTYTPGPMPELVNEEFEFDMHVTENWWDDYVGSANVDDFFPMEELRALLGVDKDVYLPFSYEAPSKYIWAATDEYMLVEVEGDYSGDIGLLTWYGVYDAYEDEGGDIIAITDARTHSYIMNYQVVYEDGDDPDALVTTMLMYRPASAVWCTELTTDEMWTGEDYENMREVIPLGYDLMVPCGADYESFTFSEPDYGCDYFIVCDHYNKDLHDVIFDYLDELGFYYYQYSGGGDCMWIDLDNYGELDVEVEWDFEYGNMIIFTYYYGSADTAYSSDYGWGDYAVPTPYGEESVISFVTEDQIISKGDEVTTWGTKEAGFKVERNGSGQTVGNATFYANPLRCYTSQVLTFEWNCWYAPSEIILTFYYGASKSKLTNISSIANATLVEGAKDTTAKTQIVTLELDSIYESQVVINLSGQLHLYDVTFSWAGYLY